MTNLHTPALIDLVRQLSAGIDVTVELRDVDGRAVPILRVRPTRSSSDRRAAALAHAIAAWIELEAPMEWAWYPDIGISGVVALHLDYGTPLETRRAMEFLERIAAQVQAATGPQRDAKTLH